MPFNSGIFFLITVTFGSEIQITQTLVHPLNKTLSTKPNKESLLTYLIWGEAKSIVLIIGSLL